MTFLFGVTVPATESTGVTVGATLPVITNGDPTRKPLLTIHGNWEAVAAHFRSAVIAQVSAVRA